MKKIFIKHLLDFLEATLNRNHWALDVGGDKALKELVESSVDKVCKSSFEDCTREEMQQFAKTNLSSLLAYMHLDMRKRGLDRLDATSVYNALRNFSCLWPFKGKEVNALKRYQPAEKQYFTWYY